MSGASATLHAGCVLLGEDGVLIRGASGTGKSRLARDLVEEASARGLFAAHVADDRTRVEARHGRLVARPVPAIAGLLEIRFHGIVRVAHAPAARVALVVDLAAEAADRLPEPGTRTDSLLDIVVRRIVATPDEAKSLVPALLRGEYGAESPSVSGRDDTLMTE